MGKNDQIKLAAEAWERVKNMKSSDSALTTAAALWASIYADSLIAAAKATARAGGEG